MLVKIKKIHQDAVIPDYAHLSDAGCDLYSIEDVTIVDYAVIRLGLAIALPTGFELQIRSKSGLAAKNGLFVLNSPATIDAGYRGEIKVILGNLSPTAYQVKKGQKIAQAILSPVLQADFQKVEILSQGERNHNGFGSTGLYRATD